MNTEASASEPRSPGGLVVRSLLWFTAALTLLTLLPPTADAQTAGTWSPTGRMYTIRKGASAIRQNFAGIFIIGGTNASASQTMEFYNPDTGTFGFEGFLNTPRVGNTATRMRDGRFLIDGGANGPSEIYDPPTGRFSYTGTPLINGTSSPGNFRSAGAAALLPDGRVLVAYGRDQDGIPLAEGETYDPTTGRYSLITTNLTCYPHQNGAGLSGVQATVLNNGQVLFTGGDNFY